MDSISEEINIKYILDDNLMISKELLINKNQKLLVDISGDLKIEIDKKIFFNESDILLLEFAKVLKKWVIEIEEKGYNDCNFVYETMDYDDEPILTFKSLEEGELWLIESPWAIQSRYSANRYLLKKEILICEINAFLKDFDEKIMEKYSITVRDFL